MIYKFKSQEAADLIMLESSGNQMLTIIGKQLSSQGIVTVVQIPAAIGALEAAVVAHEAAESCGVDVAAGELAASGDCVPLRARVGPFIELHRNSEVAGKDVVWGV